MADTGEDTSSERPEYVANATIWNSFGVLDAIAAFGIVYALVRGIRAAMQFLRLSPRHDQR